MSGWITVIIQALVVAGVTALATGFINSRIMESKLKDLTDRIVRIEHYLNGLLLKYEKRGDR